MVRVDGVLVGDLRQLDEDGSDGVEVVSHDVAPARRVPFVRWWGGQVIVGFQGGTLWPMWEPLSGDVDCT